MLDALYETVASKLPRDNAKLVDGYGPLLEHLFQVMLRVCFSPECESHGRIVVLSVTTSDTKTPPTHTHTQTHTHIRTHTHTHTLCIIRASVTRQLLAKTSGKAGCCRLAPNEWNTFAIEAEAASLACHIEHPRFTPSRSAVMHMRIWKSVVARG